jgi:predicted metal-dependent hydrolase
VVAFRAEEELAVTSAAPVTVEDVVPVEIFKAEVRRWAERIGVEANEIHVRDMTRKWASCSSRGRLTFDIDLLREPATFRAEVIVHELVHLKVPNHGKLFRSLVRSYLGRHASQSRSA